MTDIWDAVDEIDDVVAAFCLLGLFVSHLAFLIVTIQWLHPVDETPPNARLFRMNIHEKVASETGAPLLPKTMFSVRELRHLYAKKCYKTRGFELSEEDQVLLTTARDGQVNFLPSADQLFRNPSLAYGTVYSKRISCLDYKAMKVEPSAEVTTSARVVNNVLNTQDEEDAVRKPLKRHKEATTKRKKNNKKKAIHALDKMTAGEQPGEHKNGEPSAQHSNRGHTPNIKPSPIQPIPIQSKIAQQVAVVANAAVTAIGVGGGGGGGQGGGEGRGGNGNTLNTVETIDVHSKRAESRRKQLKRKSTRRQNTKQTTEGQTEEVVGVRKSLEDQTKSLKRTLE